MVSVPCLRFWSRVNMTLSWLRDKNCSYRCGFNFSQVVIRVFMVEPDWLWVEATTTPYDPGILLPQVKPIYLMEPAWIQWLVWQRWSNLSNLPHEHSPEILEYPLSIPIPIAYRLSNCSFEWLCLHDIVVFVVGARDSVINIVIIFIFSHNDSVVSINDDQQSLLILCQVSPSAHIDCWIVFCIFSYIANNVHCKSAHEMSSWVSFIGGMINNPFKRKSN